MEQCCLKFIDNDKLYLSVTDNVGKKQQYSYGEISASEK